MKKSTFVGFAVMAGLAVASFAGTEDVTIVNDRSIANDASYANSTFVRGNLTGVAVKIEDVASQVRTNTIAIVSADGQTLFSAAVVGSSTNFFPLATALYGSDAALINSSTVLSTTNKVYAPAPVASKVTCTVTGAAFPTLTNSVTVRLIFQK